MDVLWLVPPVVKQAIDAGDDPESRLQVSHLASVRLRTGVAAGACKAAGHRNLYLVPDDPAAMAGIDFSRIAVCVVGKLFLDVCADAWLVACRRAHEAGARLVLDVCDYPFEQKPPEVMRFYSETMRLADILAVNSERMAELMRPHAACRLQVIEDAMLSPPRRPEFAPGKTLELLWFGHSSNVRYLERVMDALVAYGMEQRCRLTLISEPGRGLEQAARNITAACAPRFSVRFTPWSLETTRIALRQCDLVLIPGDPQDRLKSGVSSNRIAEAIQAGRMAVASPLASYLPFGEGAWLGEDIVAGVRWAVGNRGDVLARLRRGQSLVAARLDAELIGRQWRGLLEKPAAA